MAYFDYTRVEHPVRSDMGQAYRAVWQMIAAPGNWWAGEDRVAIAAETRQAGDCPLCGERKAALSPFSVKGEHASVTNLPAAAIDAVHRIATDPSRLTETWLLDSYKEGMTDGKYIELFEVAAS